MSRERQVADSAIYLIPAVAGNLIPLVTLPIFTRILAPQDYGAWALALAYGAFVTGVANFGLTVSYDRSFFEYREGRRAAELLYSTLAFVAIAYIACIGVTGLFRDTLAAWIIQRPDMGGLLFWVCCATGMSSLKWYYLAYLRNHGEAKAYVWFTMDETLLTTAFSLFLVAYLRVGVIGLAWAQLAAASLVFVLVSIRFMRRLTPAFSAALLREALQLGYPLTPRIFLGVLGNNFDKYLLGLLASVGSVGVYAIGQKVSYLVFAYMTALENVFGPQTYRRMFDLGAGGGRAIGRYLTPFVYASFAIAMAVSLFSEEALMVLTPAAYHGAVPVVNLLTLYYAVMFFGKQPQLVYAKKTYLLSVMTMIGLAANVAFNVIGIRQFGLLGAAAGTLLAGVVTVALHNAIAMRFYRIEWEVAKLGAMLVVLAGSSALVLLMAQTDVPYGARLGVKLAAAAGYVWLGSSLGIVTRANLQQVGSMLYAKVRPLSSASPS